MRYRPMRNRAACKEAGCVRTTHSRGYCQWHYIKHRRDGTLAKKNADGVYARESAGAACGVCGRRVYDHDVTEWCFINERQAQ